MKRQLFLIIALAINFCTYSQNDKTVTLTVSSQGQTISEAKQNALRDAIEQAFGTFISSNTEILNDELVKDEIVSVSNGNIQDYQVISEVELPKRLVATTKIPQGHPDYNPDKRKDITRAKLWPWFVKTKFIYGIKIYWYLTEWPQESPNEYEKRIKSQLKEKYPNWEKTI